MKWDPGIAVRNARTTPQGHETKLKIDLLSSMASEITGTVIQYDTLYYLKHC